MNEVLKTLIDNGFEAYIVGGYVRDKLLNIPSFDIDICTNASIEELSNLFEGTIYKQYMSIHFKKGKYKYNITSFRKEITYKNNKPIKIIKSNNLLEDLKRRDFTINTILLDINGKLIDPLNGINDLNNKVIKVVGNTYEKFIEDNTRILRAIRFACILDFEFSSDIKKFLKEKVHYLNNLNNEFIKNELDIIFDKNPMSFFDIVSKYDLKGCLRINYDNIINTNKHGIWAQIECDFNFKKEDKYIIDSIKKLVNKKTILKEDISKYGKYISLTAADILNINIDEKIKSVL